MLKEDLIRDRIVIGIRDTKTSERLQLTSDLTLEKAITMARQAELQAKASKVLRKETAENSEVHRITKENKKPPYNGKQAKLPEKKEGARESGGSSLTCYRCGLRQHSDSKSCPALRSTCRNCGKMGHWDRACRAGNVRNVEQEDDEPDHNDIFLGAVSDDEARKRDFTVNVEIVEFGERTKFLIDTGADVSCISEKQVPMNFKNKIQRSDKIIYGPDGKKLPLKGYISVNIAKESQHISSKLYVLSGLKNNLLGKPEIKRLNLINVVANMQADNNINNLVKKFDKVFNGLGQFKRKLKINLKEGTQPFALSAPRSVPIPLLPKLKKKIG